MAILQTRIFVLSADPMNDWCPTLLGRVIYPVTNQFAGALRWFWFSRYISDINDSADCNITQIPQQFLQPLQPGQPARHRSIRFRFEVDDSQQQPFEQALLNVVQQSGYAISDIRPYDKVGDTGSNRFLGIENRAPGRSAQRADLVTLFYDAIARLMLDALAGPDNNGRFRMEQNDDLVQNPRGSTFQSIHHLFCNITDVPLDVLLCQRGNQIGIGTAIYPPGPLHTFDSVTSAPIRF